jgi:hypothetical protein
MVLRSAAVRQQRDRAVLEIVAIELRELIAALIARKDEELALRAIVGGGPDRFVEKRELTAHPEGRRDQMNLIRISEPRCDQHLQPGRMPAEK